MSMEKDAEDAGPFIYGQKNEFFKKSIKNFF